RVRGYLSRTGTQAAARWRETMAHPLSGADLGTIVRAFAAGGLPDRWGAAARLSGIALARAPFSAVERLAVAPRLPKLAEMPPPVFILGHWRSGTTHLYN